MKILLIGYGKMGKLIHDQALANGHQVVKIIDVDNESELYDPQRMGALQAHVAIEFTQPDGAVKHLKACMDAAIPVVCGTTGWTQHLEDLKAYCRQKQGGLFYASNFSIGVHLFWKLTAELGRMMAGFPDYKPLIEEWHHIHKLDAPSGTAITTAEKLIGEMPGLGHWHQEQTDLPGLAIKSYREGEIPGTHRITFKSGIDQISLEHQAFSRQGFVQGAVLAAEWMANRKGIYGMDDLLAEADSSKG